MKARVLFLLVFLGVFLIFVTLNWVTIVTPTALNLGFTVVNMPLGLVMLGMLALLTVFFLIFIVYMQTSVLLEARRHTKELQGSRELADKAEASRFTELRNFMATEIQKQSTLEDGLKESILTRLEQLSSDIHTAVGHSENSLAAYIAELEDRLETKFPDQKT